jgi:hypothetical protein
MERTAWTDERIDDAFTQLREEVRDMRAEMRDGFREMRDGFHGLREEDRSIRGELAQMKLFMLGGLVTILAAIIATNG